jgi:hypothetical protein
MQILSSKAYLWLYSSIIMTSVYTRSRSFCNMKYISLVGSLKMNTALEYSTRVVQEGDRRCKKSTLNDLAYLTPLRIPLMNPVHFLLYSLPFRMNDQYGLQSRPAKQSTAEKRGCTKARAIMQISTSS